MWQYNYTDELYHYGILGMRWGVHRALSKNSSNSRLMKKAIKYDQKSASLTKKSEKIHANKDLAGSNKKAVKAAKYDKKAAKFEMKALKTDNDFNRTKFESKAEKLKYKAAKNRIEGNRISKTKGYGLSAMKYSVKSDKVAKKAEKARMKIAQNKHYIEKMNRKISEISKEDLAGAYSFVKRMNGI